MLINNSMRSVKSNIQTAQTDRQVTQFHTPARKRLHSLKTIHIAQCDVKN